MALGARSTNGTTDKINFGDLSALYGGSTTPGVDVSLPLSAAGWFKVNTVVANTAIFSSATVIGGGGSAAFCFFVDGVNRFRIDTRGSGTNIAIIENPGDTNLHHWGMSFPIAAGINHAAYFDGVNVANTTDGNGRGNPAIATTVGVGHNSGGSETGFCALDIAAEVAVWTATLTAGEFAALYSGVRAYNIRPASLVFYSPIGGVESPEPDLSKNHNNGTLTGTMPVAGPPMTLFTPRWPINLDTGTTAANIYNTNYLHSFRRKFEPIAY